jgi:serine/threonine protein kinase
MAAKIIQIGKNSQSIVKEIDLLKRVNHKNTVRYYGSCIAGDDIWVSLSFDAPL